MNNELITRIKRDRKNRNVTNPRYSLVSRITRDRAAMNRGNTDSYAENATTGSLRETQTPQADQSHNETMVPPGTAEPGYAVKLPDIAAKNSYTNITIPKITMGYAGMLEMLNSGISEQQDSSAASSFNSIEAVRNRYAMTDQEIAGLEKQLAQEKENLEDRELFDPAEGYPYGTYSPEQTMLDAILSTGAAETDAQYERIGKESSAVNTAGENYIESRDDLFDTFLDTDIAAYNEYTARQEADKSLPVSSYSGPLKTEAAIDQLAGIDNSASPPESLAIPMSFDTEESSSKWQEELPTAEEQQKKDKTAAYYEAGTKTWETLDADEQNLIFEYFIFKNTAYTVNHTDTNDYVGYDYGYIEYRALGSDGNYRVYTEEEANKLKSDFTALRKDLTSRLSEDDIVRMETTFEHMIDKVLHNRGTLTAAEKATLHPIVSSLTSVPANLIGGVIDAVDTMIVQPISNLNLLTPDAYDTPTNYYAPASRMHVGASATRSTVSQNIADSVDGLGGEYLSLLYQAGMASLDSMAISWIPGAKWISPVILASGGAAEAARSAHERGSGDMQAWMTGVLSGAAEIFFEKFSIGKLPVFKNITEMPVATLSAYFLKIFTSAGVNAADESLTSVANVFADWWINQGASVYAQTVEWYMSQNGGGLSEDDAKQAALMDIAKQVCMDGAAGWISSIGSTAITDGIDYASNSSTAKSLGRLFTDADGNLDAESYSALMTEAFSSKDKGVLDYAKMLDRKGGDHVSPEDAGLLYAKLIESQQNSDQNSAGTSDLHEAAPVQQAEKGAQSDIPYLVMSNETYNAEIANMRASLSSDAQTLFDQVLESSVNKQMAAEAYQQNYMRGLRGEAFAADINSEIGTLAQQFAYEAGADAKKSIGTVRTVDGTMLSPELDSFLKKSAKDLGVSITYGGKAPVVNGVQDRGFITPNGDLHIYEDVEVHLADGRILKGDDAATMVILGHEMTHRLQQLDGESYAVFRDFVLARKSGAIEDYMKTGLSRDAAIDEIAADYAMTTLFADQKTINEVTKEHSKLAEAVRDVLDWIKTKLGIQSSELDRAIRLWNNAYNASVRNAKSGVETKNTADGDVKYSKSPFGEQVDAVLNGTFDSNNSMVNIGETPMELQEFTQNSLPLLITAKHIYTMTVSEEIAKQNSGKKGFPKYDTDDNYHQLGRIGTKRLPSALAKPVMVIKAKNDIRNTDFVVVTALRDKKGKPAIVPLLIKGRGMYEGGVIDANIVKSFYGRSEFSDYIEKALKENRILKINKERSQAIFNIPELQYLDYILSLDFSNNLAQFKQIVNTQSMQNSQNDASTEKKSSTTGTEELLFESEAEKAQYVADNFDLAGAENYKAAGSMERMSGIANSIAKAHRVNKDGRVELANALSESVWAETTGAAWQQALEEHWDTSLTPMQYRDAMLAYYEAGKSGKSIDSVVEKYDAPLRKAAKEAAYKAGQLDAGMDANESLISRYARPELMTDGKLDIQKIILELMGAEIAPLQYHAEMLKYYEAGKNGQSIQSVVDAADAKLTEDMKQAAYAAGLQDRGEHYAKGNYSIKVNNLSGEQPFSKATKQALSDEYDTFEKTFGTMDTVKGVQNRKYLNDDIWGTYNDNSGTITMFSAGGDEGLAFMRQLAKQMKKEGKWSTSSPFHAYRHELAHAWIAYMAKTDSNFDQKMSEIAAIRTRIFDSLTGLSENDIIFKRQICSQSTVLRQAQRSMILSVNVLRSI